jgi:unspecific monooxygenase
MLFLKFLQKDWGEWTPWGQMKSKQQKVHKLLQAEIEERRNNHNHQQSDILSLMMAAKDENGQAMTDEELRDELLSLLFAGHETTATILAWAFYQIHQNTDILAKLLQEINSLGENPQPMEIAQLPYLTAVCNETLRMYPVLPIIFPRITKSSMNIAGYEFEPETMLMPSIYLVHYHEDIYPQPHQFKPERFLERQYSPSEYIPFGGGSRRCLGYALALLEIKLVLATVLSNYQLALVNNKPIKLQRRGFTLAPQGGVKMMMTGKR